MDASDWDTLQRLFHAALAVEPAERPAYLDAVGFDDPALRSRLERMLDAADNDPIEPRPPTPDA